MTGKYFLPIAFVCLGFASSLPAAWSQDAAPAAPPPPAARQADLPPPAPVAVPHELSHEEMVREQERRDREAEDERDRDDL